MKGVNAKMKKEKYWDMINAIKYNTYDNKIELLDDIGNRAAEDEEIELCDFIEIMKAITMIYRIEKGN